MRPATLFEKLWNAHRIADVGDGADLIRIDRHFLHDLSGPLSLKMLGDRGLRVRAPQLTFAMADHGVPTAPGAWLEGNERALQALRAACARHGVRLFDLGSAEQGIVHVTGPELGLTLPGLSIVCGDSHTSTHGAFGALAWGVGNTEVLHVLATQALVVPRPATMRIRCEGRLAPGVAAKDLILTLIGRLGTAGASGHAVEFAGTAIDAMSMEDRMSLCNLATELGATFALIAPDAVTEAYVRDRAYAPRGAEWTDAVAAWRRLPTDPEATFDSEVVADAAAVAPQVTWGVTPQDVAGIDGRVPDPAAAPDPATRRRWEAALDYMGLQPGAPISGVAIQNVFIGSCANGRLGDLQAAAHVVRGRRVPAHVRAWIVPGSQAVSQAARAEGLDRVFLDAGFAWREPGCSMCLGMNGDVVAPGERCVSTSNRNFVGRQGPGARTHLASPQMAAAAAVAGALVDVREILR
ncbi:3-isopropylmalate dehydratase large subunit [Phenylobacterium sp. SCN 70-31]|uniref:3-isopropylmalate dehydratase large subunit n=1 Tax=Phenylobacterium sp. SCN 70-31 TaxID=1660129 RepID=UPI00086B0030|nr:3-isopropylmalate dehydratase large subunit [Phenylobacterium sp. SCN 70-31]ODT89915.1 MAG: 3-isopropylmalate dehydratase large subunit [Phenylobacterium sp. SCN 70-31]